MRRALFVIPHYYAPGNAFYGSTGSDPNARASALERVIGGLHQSLGARQAFLISLQQHVPGKGNGHVIHANTSTQVHLEIAICTTGDKHLLRNLSIPDHLYSHHSTQTDPMLLGFAARDYLKANLGRYDWYCYLEDDLLITDSLLFSKLEWFVATHGEMTTLSPHRFERSLTEPAHKLYIDGSVHAGFTAPWQDVKEQQYLEADHYGMNLRFERWPNPHSGCFFLTAHQMAQWAGQNHFMERDCSFAGPLESAASLGIIKTFRQYKPSPQNASFFEIEHLHPRYLGESLKFQ
jgi:hypothetical protein